MQNVLTKLIETFLASQRPANSTCSWSGWKLDLLRCHNCCVRWTVVPARWSEMGAWTLSSKVWCICPSRYTGGTLFQVWLARFRWGRGRASFKSGHKEVKNYTCAAPRAPAAPANDPKRQANTSVSGRRRTVTKREFIKWNLKSSWCLGRGCWSNQ